MIFYIDFFLTFIGIYTIIIIWGYYKNNHMSGEKIYIYVQDVLR